MFIERLVENMHPIVSLSGGIELFAGFITIVLLIGSLFEPNKKHHLGKCLIAMLITHAIMQFSDAFLWFLIDIPEYVWIVRILNIVTHFACSVLFVMYTYCLVLYISPKKKVPMGIVYATAIFVVINVTMWFASNENGMFYYFDANGVYCYGPLIWISKLSWVILLVGNTGIVLYYRKALGLRDTLALISYGALPLISLPLEFLWDITPFYLTSTLSLILVYMVIHLDQSKRLQRQEKELTQSRISIMLSQIQPHFLYNSLSVIQDMCHEKAPEAEETVIEFAEFLRSNMDSINERNLIPFLQELKHTKNFLSLEQKCFGKQLNVEYDIQTTMFRLPSLTIQPIVENAVKYGVMSRVNGGTVFIKTRETEDNYSVIVSDDGTGFDANMPKMDGRTHIGISNVKSRLREMCGGDLIINSTLNEGTVCEIIIPKEAKHL